MKSLLLLCLFSSLFSLTFSCICPLTQYLQHNETTAINIPSNAVDCNCKWTVSSSAGHLIFLKFSQFQLATNDFLSVFDGSSVADPLIANFTRTTTSHSLVSTTNQMTFKLVTVSYNQNSILATVTAIDPSYYPGDNCQCYDGTVYLDTVGSIEFLSPNYPKNYCNNAHCKWTIKAPIGEKVHLQFSHFDTEQSYDTVKIYDGSRDYGSPKQSCSGSSCTSLTSSGQYLTVEFTSDNSNTYKGFVGLASATTSSCACSGNRHITLSSSTDSAVISSPDYPNDYCNNLICGWSIEAPIGYGVSVTFDHFETESNYDFVSIYDGSNSYSNEIESCSGYYCNSATSTSRNMFIRFTTDNSNVFSGWQATARPATCNTQCDNNYGTKDLYYDGDSVTINSPNYPSSYCPGSSCNYKIRAPPGDVISLSFSNFNLGNNDFVEIYDGNSRYDNSLKICYGYSLWCDSVTSTGRYMYVRFSSSSSSTTSSHSGFSATAYAQQSSLSTGAVVGITFGVIAAFFVLIVILSVIRRRRFYRNRQVIPTGQPVVAGYVHPEPSGYPAAAYPPLPTYNQAVTMPVNPTQPDLNAPKPPYPPTVTTTTQGEN